VHDGTVCAVDNILAAGQVPSRPIADSLSTGGSEPPNASAQRSALMIYQLQYLRAIAALSVVLCHASYYVRYYRDDPRMWAIFDRTGGFGVVLFFAISGYLMAHLAQTTSGLRFMAHRLIRIYPIYWLCALAVVAADRLSGAVAPSIDPLALLLVPGATTSYVLGVEWTLPFELTFYIIVFAIIVSGLRHRLPLLAAIWIVAIEAMFSVRPDLQQGQFPLLLQLPLSQYSVAFAGGLLVPFAIRQRWIGPATLLLALGSLAVSEAMPGVALSFGLMCLGCVLLVSAAVQPRDAVSQPPNRTLVALGDWSYGLYLCHVPIIIALCRALPGSVPSMQLWFAAVGLPVVAAIGIGKLDLSLYRLLKRRIDRSGDWVLGILCAVFLMAVLGVSGTTYVRLIEIRRESAHSVVLASRIAAAMAVSHLDLSAAAQSVGLRPDNSLYGFFDGANKRSLGEVFIQGWAADGSGSRHALQVLVFQCGHFLGVELPLDSRPDVGAVLRIGPGRYGFHAILPEPANCTARMDGLLVTKDGGYSLISTLVRN
jgi:peptidoglycan/LPS O-acetylase OafA/YrhL